MEAQIWAANGYTSDTDSVRSEITAPVSNDHVVRKGRGRKGKPQRAAFDGYHHGAARDTCLSIAAPSLGQANQECAAVQPQMISDCNVPASAATAFNDSTPANDTSEHAVPRATATASAEAALATATPSGKSSKKSKQDLAGPCCHCNAVSSPQWRKGPKGKPVLCNACGIRFLRNRTLTKVVPKKRRAGSSAAATPATVDTAVPQPKRLKTVTATTEDEDVELATDEVLATDDATATDEGMEETISAQHEQAALQLSASRLALASAPDTTAVAAAAAAAAEAEVERELEQLEARTAAAAAAAKAALTANTSSSSVSYNHSLLGHAAAGTHQPLAAGSRHVLLGSSSRLSHSPVLSLALALHQQQQHQKSAPHSPVKVGTSCFAASTSPVSHTSAYISATKLDQSEYSAGSGSAPASPLMLGATSIECQLPILGLSSGLEAEQAAQQLENPSYGLLSLLNQATAPPAPQADVLQLVQQVASVLGGVGPAVEFVKAMHNSQVAAAAAAAAAASAAVQLWQ